MRRAWPSALLLAAACGAPGAPEIPPRDEIGPPPEAALPSECVPPYPMLFGDDWYLLADLDRGVACYAFLERDECIVGIFHDCTDDSTDPRQWRGVLTQELLEDNVTKYKEALLRTEYEPRSQARLSRSPACCQGEVHEGGADHWARLQCQIERCGAINDVAHAGLYLARYDPTLDPSVAIGARYAVPAGTLDLAYDADAATLWGLTEAALFTLDPATGASQTQSELTSATALAAGGGFAYAANGARLVIAAPDGAARAVELPGPAKALAAVAGGVVVALDPGDVVWRVDAASGTRTASAALGVEVAAMHGAAPTYLVTEAGDGVYTLDASLRATRLYDSAAHPQQTGGAYAPRAPFAGEAAVGVIGPCNAASSKEHCVFEVRGDPEVPRRHAVAGVERLLAARWSPPRRSWITVGEAGRITEVDADTSRPLLQRQVRLERPLRAAAYAPATHQIFALDADGAQVTIVNLGSIP